MPGPPIMICVNAIRCRAVLICRLPVVLLRIVPSVLPDHIGIGPTPAKRAKADSLGKRVTSAVSPTIFAAMSGPHPGRASSDGAILLMCMVMRRMQTFHPTRTDGVMRRSRWGAAAAGGHGLIAAGGKQVWVSSGTKKIRYREILE